MTESIASFSVVIKPKRWFNFSDILNFKQKRAMVSVLAIRELKVRYRNTFLGPLWNIFQPLLSSLTYFAIFNKVVGIKTGNIPGPLFYLTGIIVWQYFSQSVEMISSSLQGNRLIYSKIYLWKLAIPISTLLNKLIVVITQLFSILLLLVFYRLRGEIVFEFDGLLLLLGLIPVLFLSALFALGVGLWASTVSIFIRDILSIQAYLLQLMLYATPILYPTQSIPLKYQTLLKWNPLFAILDFERSVCFHSAPVDWRALLQCTLLILLVLSSGYILYHHCSQDFIDRV